MSDLSFADVKVHNEIEYCTVHDIDVKAKIEKAFLHERISYYEKWEDIPFFKRLFGEKEHCRCTLCINSMQKEKANEVMEKLGLDQGQVEMILKRVDKTFF